MKTGEIKVIACKLEGTFFIPVKNFNLLLLTVFLFNQRKPQYVFLAVYYFIALVNPRVTQQVQYYSVRDPLVIFQQKL